MALHGVYEAAQVLSPQCAVGMLQTSASGHSWACLLHTVVISTLCTLRGETPLEVGHLICQCISASQALTARICEF